MNKEQKEILIKDLIPRLRHGVKVLIEGLDVENNKKTTSIEKVVGIDERFIYTKVIDEQTKKEIGDNKHLIARTTIKPYLFTMESLTCEQRTEISEGIKNIRKKHPPFGAVKSEGTDNLLNSITMAASWLINYYIERHLDYNGLIEKDIAINCQNLKIYE